MAVSYNGCMHVPGALLLLNSARATVERHHGGIQIDAFRSLSNIFISLRAHIDTAEMKACCEALERLTRDLYGREMAEEDRDDARALLFSLLDDLEAKISRREAGFVPRR